MKLTTTEMYNKEKKITTNKKLQLGQEISQGDHELKERGHGERKRQSNIWLMLRWHNGAQ